MISLNPGLLLKHVFLRLRMEDLENGLDKPTESTSQNGKKTTQPEGPDGSKAWIVALAACMINFIMAGLGRMSGILYVAFIDEFQVDRKLASTPFSLRSSIRNLLGPIVGILGQKYGIRMVCIMGGVLGTISAALCFFTTDIVWITMLWGGLGGVGSALTVILPQVVIGQYFLKHRTTASGIAFSGGCVGAFLLPTVLEHFILNCGIEGTFLVMAGIIMNTIPAAMILRRPSWLKNKGGERSTEAAKQKDPTSINGLGEGNVNSENGIKRSLGKVEYKNLPDVQFLRENNHLLVKMLSLRPLYENTLSVSMAVNRNSSSAAEICILEELEDMFRCIQYSSEKPQFYQNLKLSDDNVFGDSPRKEVRVISGLKNRSSRAEKMTESGLKPGFKLLKASSAPDISKISKEISSNYVLQKLRDLFEMNEIYVAARFPEENKRKVFKLLKELKKMHKTSLRFDGSVANSAPKSEEKLSDSQDDEKNVHRNSFFDHVRTAVRLHKNPLFLLVCFCRAVHFVTFIPVMTTVVDFIVDKGLQEEDGKYAIGAISLGDLMGRLCLGWVTDRGYISMSKYMMVAMVIQGAFTASLPLMHGKVALFITLALFGMFEGSLFVRHPVLVSKYMEPHQQSIAMGCINFFSGILGFGLPTYIGYFRDTLGSYDYIFVINGALGAVIGLLWCLEPYFLRRLKPIRSTNDDVAPV